jgi:DNA polymerase-1
MQPTKYVYLDSEFNATNERQLNVLCFALVAGEEKLKFWFPEDLELFKRTIGIFATEGYTFVSFNVESEASALLSLDINPLKFTWIDLYLEYVMLSNHNNDISKGSQLIHGKIKKLPNHGFEKGSKSLASALYKLCDIKIDTEHKTKMRDLIISSPASFSETDKKAILDYCLEDTLHLPLLLKRINLKNNEIVPNDFKATFKKEAHWRAEYAVRTAVMVRHGYPVNVEWVKNLTENIPVVMRNLIEDINEQFPDIKPFKFNKNSAKYTMDTKAVRKWIESSGNKGWEKTETGLLSLALDAFKKFYSYSHDYPRGNFGAQMVRYFNMAQQLKGFSDPSGSKNNTFWDYVGSDGMVHPYMNIYGAQSSRSQPSSTSFLFLKTGWVRSLCVPPAGYAVGAIDYSSQEFLLSAVCSGDRKMIDAYRSGDVYLAYAKGIGLVPKDGTKETHGKERDLCKATVLGLSYMMSEFGLSIDLTEKLGREVTPDEAKELVKSFYELFSTFSEWRERSIDEYYTRKYLRLPDGYYMWGDNPNFRSVGNAGLQGFGACIMRKAVQLAQDAGLNVIFTLHDALYIMFKSDDLEAMDTLKRCMFEAFVFYFDGKSKEDAKLIRMDGKVWSMDYQDGEMITKDNFKLESQKYFVDKRSKKQYSQFSRYFQENLNLELL